MGLGTFVLFVGLAGCSGPQRCIAIPGAGGAFGQEFDLAAKVFPEVPEEALLLASLKGLVQLDPELTVSSTEGRSYEIVLRRGQETDTTTINFSWPERDAVPNILIGARKISPAIAAASRDRIEGEMIEALLAAYPHDVDCRPETKPAPYPPRFGNACERFEPRFRFSQFDEALVRAYRNTGSKAAPDVLVMAGLKGLADLDPELSITKEDWAIVLQKPGKATSKLSLIKVEPPEAALSIWQQFARSIINDARRLSPQVEAAGEDGIQRALVAALAKSYPLPNCAMPTLPQ